MMHPATFARSTLAFPILLLAAGFLDAKKANRVAVRAEATKEYTLARALDKTKKVQTYHLIKGMYLGGNEANEELDEMDFLEIAEHIQLNLRRQKYFPEEDPAAGDLLIMVHYGASFYIDDPENPDERDVFDINDYLPPVRAASGEVYDFELSKKALPKLMGTVLPSDRNLLEELYFRTRILGMDDVFSLDVTDYESSVQVQLSNEGRYFIILTAFDLPLLKKGEKKVLWTTRYSIRRIGQSYAQALKELNIVAGFYFGKNIKGLISKRATDKSIVEFGEIEVLGPEVEETD